MLFEGVVIFVVRLEKVFHFLEMHVSLFILSPEYLFFFTDALKLLLFLDLLG